MKFSKLIISSLAFTLDLPINAHASLSATIKRNESIHSIARDLDRIESVREVKDIQRAFSQYSQFGRWKDMAALFSPAGNLTWIKDFVCGPSDIETWLRDYAGGMDGIQPGSVNLWIVDTPLVIVSAGGETAKGRWNGLHFMGDGNGETRITGGVYENEYTRNENGWQISVLHYHELYSGDFNEGWRTLPEKSPIVKKHFTAENAGVVFFKSNDSAPETNATVQELTQRINSLNDEDAVRNLQHAYGYYIDRRMWSDVTDLFTENATVTLGGEQLSSNRSGVAKFLERMGPANLTHGILNDHPIFNSIVYINGSKAVTRGIELGMIGNSNDATSSWEFSVFYNRFVKGDDDIWRFQELNITPLIVANHTDGWGDKHSQIVSHDSNTEPPPFIDISPRKSRAVNKDSTSSEEPSLAELARRLARSIGWDGTDNVSNAYGFIIDDLNCKEMGILHAEHANKLSPFTGYYFSRARITEACAQQYGNNRTAPRTFISFHWRPQPVILVSDDGRSATLRARLFQPRANVTKSEAALNAAMYHDQTVLDVDSKTGQEGWKLWTVTIDEHYLEYENWQAGWAAHNSSVAAEANFTSTLFGKYRPDLTVPELGIRQAGFKGGITKQDIWPSILTMWFQYRNPVSGTVPEKYWEPCAPCRVRPEWSLNANGYQDPPTGPPLHWSDREED